MPPAENSGPAWVLLRLALPVLGALLAAGCLLRAGEGTSAALGAGLPVATSDVQASPDGPVAGTGQGHCAKKKAVAEPSPVAPAAEPAPVPPAVTAADGARSGGTAWQAPRSGPAPPPPDLYGLRVLRI